MSSYSNKLLHYFSTSQEFIQTLDEELAKKLATRALQRGVGSMDYIDMLLIQEDPEDENDDAALPSSLSLSPP